MKGLILCVFNSVARSVFRPIEQAAGLIPRATVDIRTMKRWCLFEILGPSSALRLWASQCLILGYAESKHTRPGYLDIHSRQGSCDLGCDLSGSLSLNAVHLNIPTQIAR